MSSTFVHGPALSELSAAIASEADVVAVRGEARAMAAEAGFDAADTTVIVTVVTELARNIVRHAGEGEIRLGLEGNHALSAFVIVAADRGPGIAEVERALEDGFSTSGAPGIGLPAVRRLVDDFRIDSSPQGTVVTAKKWIAVGAPRGRRGWDRHATRSERTPRTPGFERQYRRVLLQCLVVERERALDQAYQVGRQAMADGLGILDVVEIHDRLVAELLLRRAAVDAATLESARLVLAEALAAFEIANRGFRAANGVLRHFNEVLEAEMKRVAQFLHDDTGQLIAAMHLELDLAARAGAGEAERHLHSLRYLVSRVEAQVRRASHEMRPPVLDDCGLVAAFEFLGSGLEQRSRLRVRVQGPADQRFPETIEVSVYRVVQEALTNIVKHARASTVDVLLECSARSLRCSVRDDGVGFDAGKVSGRAARGMGLVSMRHHVQRLGGELELRSTPGRGTQVDVCVPL